MKRLFPFLIIAAFIFGIAGGGVGRPHVQIKIRPCPQDCPNLLANLPEETILDNWDVAAKPAAHLSNPIFLLPPSQEKLLPSNWRCSLSPKHYAWLGLGCGGLPS